MTDDLHDEFEERDEGHVCPRCDGWRQVSCHCGGDLCVCENYGEMDCPLCGGEGDVSDEVFAKWCERRREFAQVMKESFERASQNKKEG